MMTTQNMDGYGIQVAGWYVLSINIEKLKSREVIDSCSNVFGFNFLNKPKKPKAHFMLFL